MREIQISEYGSLGSGNHAVICPVSKNITADEEVHWENCNNYCAWFGRQHGIFRGHILEDPEHEYAYCKDTVIGRVKGDSNG